MRSPGRPYTDDDIRKLKRMWREQVPVKRIALELDRSIGSLMHKIHDLGLPKRRQNGKVRVNFMLTPEELQKLDRRAAYSGKTRSAYLRYLVLVDQMRA